MAPLAEGQKFNLDSKAEKTKSVVFVKLTDSALRSFEEYLKHRALLEKNGASGPSIQFCAAGGVFSLPGERGGTVSLPFGLAATEDGGPGKQSSSCCLRATHGTLQSVGGMGETLRVKASEDSAFKRIQQGFDKVKMENQKKGTVMLDDKDKKKSRGVSAPRPRPGPPLAPGRPPLPSLPEPGRGGSPSARTAPPAPRPPVASPSLRSPGFREAVSTHPAHQPKHKPYPSAHKPNKPSGGPVNPEIMKRSLRERLVHLLAVRAQKKMELHTRIYKDGIKEKDKKSNMLSSVLREVAECKNNVYELKRAMWNDVDESWPFYTAEDRAALKRRKPQNLTPPGSDTGSTSSGHSPSSTNPASPPQIQCGLKRDSYSSRFGDPRAGEPPSTKKIRVSTYKRPGEPPAALPAGRLSSHGVSPLGGLGSLPLGPCTVGQELDLGSFEPCHDESAPDWAQFQDGEAAEQEQARVASPGRELREPEEAMRPPSPEPEEAAARGAMQLQRNTNRDFAYHFSAIVSASQRSEYKAVYNESYAKYRQLHQTLDTVTKRAASLQAELKRVSKGSPESKAVKRRIKEEFGRTRTDPACQEAFSSFQYLHEKLAHIKRLVHDYDTARVAAGGR